VLRGSDRIKTKENTSVINVAKNNTPPLIIDERKDSSNNKIIAADSNSVADSSHKLIAPTLPGKDSLTSAEKPLVAVANMKKADTTATINNDPIQTPVNKNSKYISSNKNNITVSSSKKPASVSFRSIQ
jgi:hypothetical protein